MRAQWLAFAGSVLAGLMLAGLMLAGSALAQNPPIQGSQLPPLQQQDQPSGSPPVPQAPVPQAPVHPAPVPVAPLLGAPAAPAAPGSTAQGPTAPATFDRPNIWVPAKTAKLVALDKVDAQATDLTLSVGQSATFGSLTITVKACVVRPPDQPVDAAAFLQVTDSHPDMPGFDGWMLEDEPSVSLLQNPLYDLRVAGCT